MPIKNGYSEKTMRENIAELSKSKPRNIAIVIAKNHARYAFFTRFPHGVLPWYLLIPGADQTKVAYLKWRGEK